MQVPSRQVVCLRGFLSPVLAALVVAVAGLPCPSAAQGLKTSEEIARALIGGPPDGADAAATQSEEDALVFRSIRRVPVRPPANPAAAAATVPAGSPVPQPRPVRSRSGGTSI